VARKCAACHRGRALVMVQNRESETMDYICLRCFGVILEREMNTEEEDG